MGMYEHNVAIPFDHFDPFLIGCIPGVASYAVLKEILAPPPALQYSPDVERNIPW
jgi:hypothetical protein